MKRVEVFGSFQKLKCSLCIHQKGVPRILDGDMLIQFLELTNAQQAAVLGADASPPGSSLTLLPTPVSSVVRLLECIHYTLG